MRKIALTIAAILMVLITAACPSKVPTASAPPPPPAPAPASPPAVASFSAEPTIISNGSSATLRWSVKDASSVQIDNGVGQVDMNDRKDVHPSVTTTYTLQAKNAGGASSATVTVTVSNPPGGAGGTAGQTSESSAEVFASQLKDVHFPYGTNEATPSEQTVIESNAAVLKNILRQDPGLQVIIEGHCDERGSAEFNFALGDRRAGFVKENLVRLGVPEAKLDLVSFGKERPICLDATEDCFARNRRAHFSLHQGADHAH